MTKVQSGLEGTALVDEYFIENRNRVLELAAFLDRLDRHARTDDVASDFRVRALREALAALSGAPDRLQRVQLIFSDPTTEPRETLDRKGAVGAFDGPRAGGRS